MSKVAAKWIKTEADKRAVAAGCRFDLAAAKHVCEFFEEFLKHSKGEWAGKAFELLPWERDILYQVFGWMRADGTRRYRRAYVEVAKKNGKSTLGAGIGIYLLLGDDEGGAEVYSAATKRDQAAICHDEAVRMVRASSDLADRLKVNLSTKTVTYESENSKYAALAAEAAGSEGLNIHGLIIDELHAWTNRAFWDSLRYGGAARRQPLVFIITTAGIFDKQSIGWQAHQQAVNVLEGTAEDEEFFAYIATAPKEMDIEDPEAHKLANPSYGVTIDPAEIAKAAKDAKERPSEENIFRRYRLNQWTEQAVRWISMDKWDACQCELDPEQFAGQACYGGLDLATTTDTTAFILIFPGDDGEYAVLAWFWTPEEKARERSRRDNVDYLTWANQGFMELTPGNVTDYAFVRAKINELAQRFGIQEIAYDPWNATQLATQLQEDDGIRMVEFRQGYKSMNEPTKFTERLILAGQLHHDGNPVLRWHVSNATIRTDPAGCIKPDKERSTERIDGVVGTIMAIGRAMGEAGSSVYEGRGLLTF